MKTEYFITAPSGIKLRFTPDMVDKKDDFFHLYFLDMLINKELSKEQYIIAWLSAAGPLVNIFHDEKKLKDDFFDIFWRDDKNELEQIVTKVYNIFNESTSKATKNKVP